MIRPPVALLLGAGHGFRLHDGWMAAHSVAGNLEYYTKGIAYKMDGHVRLPGFALCFAGGILLLATG